MHSLNTHLNSDTTMYSLSTLRPQSAALQPLVRRRHPPFRLTTFPLLLLLLILLFLHVHSYLPTADAYPFRDVSVAAGLSRRLGRRSKYGGAAIADLNGDGYPDLLLGHHGNGSIELYYNNRDGTFTLSAFFQWRDTHALTPALLSPNNRRMHFLLSRGGNYGRNPSPPHVFRTTHDRNVVVEETANSPNLRQAKGRGRSVIFMSLRMQRRRGGTIRPDALVLNARGLNQNVHHYAFEIGADNKFKRMSLNWEFASKGENYATVADVDGDGQMEVILLHDMTIWRLTADFTLSDISSQVLPSPVSQFRSVSSLAEFDFDNDGDWDLVMTRSATMDLRWTRGYFPRHDMLLRNDGGRYVDVSSQARIPRSGRATLSRGLTVGDFDNDGYMDIFIVRFDHNPSMILLRNNGDGTFSRARHGLGERRAGIPGDMATAVDYDMDGRLDLVISEGDWFDRSKAGYYRIVRNVFNNGNSFLLVRVRNSPGGSRTTALHAVVRVKLTDGTRLMRRVGTPSASVSLSCLETVHFGLGKRRWVVSILVTWMNGVTRSKMWVRANSTVTLGV